MTQNDSEHESIDSKIVGDIKIQGDGNVTHIAQGDYNTFNNTQIFQILADEIKKRSFIAKSPYKGLKKFESEDKDRFFGRDQFLKALVTELDQTNLILLLGASGSGKSSVVRAGLIPWLERSTQWVKLTFAPDQDPFESLYRSLGSQYRQADAQIAREARVDTLTQVVTTLRQPDSHWLIFIDQFEELFTTTQAEKRDRFIESLVQLNAALKLLGQPKGCPVKLIATMRADFLDRLSPYPALVKATNQHRPMIAEMQSDELRMAIEQPAAHHGVVFEAGLVDIISKDVQGQAGYLPLLQYTLALLWEQELQRGAFAQDRTLQTQTYWDLGGVRGALQKHVDQIYDSLTEPERVAAQRIFLKLVEIGGDEESGTEWKPVRRRAGRSEFQDALEERVLTRLIDENLLVSDRQPQAEESTVEIAHEILLTSWEKLNTWIKENRRAITLRNRLNDDVGRWQAKKSEDELWTGSKLEQVLELRKDPTFNQVLGGFSSTANRFIDSSLGLRDRQLRRTRIFAGVGVTLAVLASAGAIFAGYQSQQAARQRVEQYASTSEALIATNPTEALVNAVSAYGLSRSLFIQFPNYSTPLLAKRALFNATQVSREENFFQLSWSKISRMRLSSDGQHVLAISDGILYQWALKGSSPKEIFRVPDPKHYFLRVSSNGQRILTGKIDDNYNLVHGTIQLRNGTGMPISEPLQDPPIENSDIEDLTSDGRKVISCFTRNRPSVIIWNLQDYTQKRKPQRKNSYLELYQFYCGGDGINFSSFSPDERWFAGGGLRTTDITIVDLKGDLLKKKLLSVPINDVNSVAIRSDGHEIVLGNEEGHVYAWKLFLDKDTHSSSERISLKEAIGGRRQKAHATRVSSIAFSSDGHLIASGSEDGTIRLWNADSFTPFTESMQIRKTAISSLIFTIDGKHLLSLSTDDIVRLWDIKDNSFASWKYEIQTNNSRFSSIGFSSDGQYIIAKYVYNYVGEDEGSIVKDLKGKDVYGEKGEDIIKQTDISKQTNIGFSPDGTKVVRITNDEQEFQMYEVKPELWLEAACNRLHDHPILLKPETDVARGAKATCQQYVWSKNQSSEIPSAEVTHPLVFKPQS